MAKISPLDSVSYFTIKGTNKVVRVGDSVLMSPPDQYNRLRVALVKWIERVDNNNMNVHVLLYYRPEESFGGRREFHGARELFLSDQYVVKSVDAIKGKCIVHTLKNYTELRRINPWDYYSRFQYSVSSGTYTPDSVAVYCKCELPPNPDEFMMQCRACRDWFHPLCVGITMGYAKRMDQYVCPDCSSDDSVVIPPVPFPESPAPGPASNVAV